MYPQGIHTLKLASKDDEAPFNDIVVVYIGGAGASLY
jgi:hypothetical protein